MARLCVSPVAVIVVAGVFATGVHRDMGRLNSDLDVVDFTLSMAESRLGDPQDAASVESARVSLDMARNDLRRISVEHGGAAIHYSMDRLRRIYGRFDELEDRYEALK